MAKRRIQQDPFKKRQSAKCKLRTFAWIKLIGTGIMISIIFQTTAAQKLDYPATKKDNIIDDYHGVKVADPYRWLEDAESTETQAWVSAQNRLTSDFMTVIPAREQIEQWLTRLWNYPKYSVPVKYQQRYFYFKNDGLQNQFVLYLQQGLNGEPVVVIDPNQLSKDGTISLTDYAFTEDGSLLAYALSYSGSDWQEIRVREVDTGKDFAETIRWCKFTGIAWRHDNSGFYYNRYPEPGSVPPEDQYCFNRVYWHQLGTPQQNDQLIFERPDAKELGFSPMITEDGKYLVLYVWHGTEPQNRIYYREVDSNTSFVRLLDEADANYQPIGNDGTIFYFRTDINAPRGRIIAIDLQNPARENWREILPQQSDVISSVTMVNRQFVVELLHDAHDLLRIYQPKGEFVQEIVLPTLGSLAGLSGRLKDTEMFIGFTSFLYPTTIFRYDFTLGKLNLFREPEIQFDADNYETKQVFYPAKDGTKIPMFIVHKKGLELDGKNPTILYGYGGFDISETPSFSIARLFWLENGGVYAVANLRGGGEYGEEWHQEGMLAKKQNVFDDFTAAAVWLIKNGYTDSTRLAINGGSNGGLLVAACLVQHPTLFGAVVCQVPVIDMLRYHKFTVGRYWVNEYGSAEGSLEQFRFLYAYSPLHNVKSGIAYPPTLITTADTDDRVAPAHAKKFAATLQAAQIGPAPILLRVETKAGHGGGKPTSKVIEEQSDIYAFLFEVFGMKMK